MDLAGSFVVAFSALFVVVDPIGVAPTFLSLVAGRPDDEVRGIALRASVVGALVLTAFTLGGGLVLERRHHGSAEIHRAKVGAGGSGAGSPRRRRSSNSKLS